MKILFLSGQYPPATKGGGEISTHLIAQGLQLLGHEVHVVAEGNDSGQGHVDGVLVHRLPLGLTSKPLFESKQSRIIARRLLKTIGNLTEFDAIHGHDFRSALALYELQKMLPLPGVILAATVRDYAGLTGDTNYILRDGSIPKNPFSFWTQWRSNRVAEVSFPRNVARFCQFAFNIRYRKKAFESIPNQIFISHAQQKEIAKHKNLESVHKTVIYNPVSPEYILTPTQKGEDGKVLYVGRVEMYKGVGLLLEAWQELVDKNTHIQLEIPGTGAQKAEYEKLIQQAKLQYRVHMIDSIPYEKIRQKYDECEILVAPHLWIEPFGRTVVEAMARGKLVIAANRGGPAETIQHEKTGLLFESGSKKSLVAALERAFSMGRQEREEIQRNARQWVKDNLSIEKIAGEYEKFYTQVTGNE